MRNERTNIHDLYFSWMVGKIRRNPYNDYDYRALLTYLNDVEFKYSIPMDSNRELDAVNMRYRFGREAHIGDYEIASTIDLASVSVLEMMVALSIRCEEDFMESPVEGDRTGIWFWEMINSLGMLDMYGPDIDYRRAEDIMNKFLNRKYSKNGAGGLFTVDDCPYDLRTIEIWYQMHYYFEKYYM